MKALALAVLAVVAAGCTEPVMPPVPGAQTLEAAVRVRIDGARDRRWVLGLDYVEVHDIRTKQLIRRIALPEWYIADLMCEPDLALDATGKAFVSHNLQPKLWEIDAHTFELKEHAIRLVGREHWDTGFGGLAFTAHGALLAVTAAGASLWSIDLTTSSARQITLGEPLPDDCKLAARILEE